MRVGEGWIDGFLLARRHNVPKWRSVPDILLDGDLPCNQRKQVGCVGLCHFPVRGAAAIFDRVADGDSVTDHFPLRGNGRNGFGGREVIWVIPSHCPLAVKASLTLRPKAIFVRICLCRNHPVPATIRAEAAALLGASGVLSGDNGCRCRSKRRREVDNHKLTAALKDDFLAIHKHSLNGQALADMELSGCQRLYKRADGVERLTGECSVCFVDIEDDLEVKQIIFAVRSVGRGKGVWILLSLSNGGESGHTKGCNGGEGARQNSVNAHRRKVSRPRHIVRWISSYDATIRAA